MSKVKKEKELTPDEKMKCEIAEELGLYELVKAGGWKSLTAKQAGQIGALCRGGKEREQNRRIDTQSGEAVHGESIKKAAA